MQISVWLELTFKIGNFCQLEYEKNILFLVSTYLQYKK